MDTWYAVYEKTTGRLHSVGTVLADPMPDIYGTVTLAGEPAPGYGWDTSALQIIAPSPQPKLYTELEFMKLFDLVTEQAPIYVAARTDGVVTSFLARLSAADPFPLSNSDVQAGMAYLVSKNIITQAVSDRVLANG